MAENLIFGKTILDFGAKGDGKSDDTEAFVKAFESRETLICIPYGTYNVTKQFVINSGVKIQCHKRALINFKGAFAQEGATWITVSGGEWNCTDEENCAFDFSGCNSCVVENARIHSNSDCVIGLSDCKNVIIEKTSLVSCGTASGIAAGGDVSFVKLSEILFDGCTSALEFVSGCSAYGIIADKLELKDCDTCVYVKDAKLENSVVCAITGQVKDAALKFENSEAFDVSFRNISVFDGYIHIENSRMNMFKIEHFTRLTELESDPLKPSFTMKSCTESTLICDGIPLDAVILSKKSVPDVKMTAAKLASAYPTAYNYTVELPLGTKDNYIIPTGGVESIIVIAK